jgi:hypothetical protein
MSERFEYKGTYRVQSRRTAVSSALAGLWLTARPGLLEESAVNTALARDPRWQGNARVTLRPALVSRRSGQFASERDILYKRAFFCPDAGAPPMHTDIVDVRKSERLWAERIPYLKVLFGQATAAAIAARLAPLDVVIANEYYLHEAGHFLGRDVLNKYDVGYFAVDGKAAWPLIYLEETRADLEGFGLALQLLGPEQAASSFLYTISLRFGVHLAGVREEAVAPYGTIPYLLFHILRAIGFFRLTASEGTKSFEIDSLDTDYLTSVMEQCAGHAGAAITGPETSAETLLDSAIAGASYVRSRIADAEAAAEFDAVMRGS